MKNYKLTSFFFHLLPDEFLRFSKILYRCNCFSFLCYWRNVVTGIYSYEKLWHLEGDTGRLIWRRNSLIYIFDSDGLPFSRVKVTTPLLHNLILSWSFINRPLFYSHNKLYSYPSSSLRIIFPLPPLLFLILGKLSDKFTLKC